MTAKNKEEIAVAPAAKNGFSLISGEKLLQLYSTMLKCRMISERAGAYLRQSKFAGNGYPAAGQEAAVVGVAIDLLPEDTIAPWHGDFITNFIKGVPLGRILCNLFALAASRDKGRSASARASDPPPNEFAPPVKIAEQLNNANGAALANKTGKNGKIAVSFVDGGAMLLGSWHDALNFAGVHDLPIVFVCKNYGPVEAGNMRAPSETVDIAYHAQGCGLPSITVDGNDVVAVYRVASESIARARLGRGPTLIDCRTDHQCGHLGSDLITEANAGKPALWEANCPLLSMEKYLTSKGLFSEEFKRGVAAGFSRELEAAFEAAQKSFSAADQAAGAVTK
jgi:TPP-dependent pyruvate/acetoin dehydrogenase alpha subunit